MKYRIFLFLVVLTYFSCSKPADISSPNSTWALGKVEDVEFFYTGDTLPSMIYKDGIDTFHLNYDPQKKPKYVEWFHADTKTAIVFQYQGSLLAKVIHKSTISSYEPGYSDPAYENSPDLSNATEYDSLVYQNNRLVAKYRFIAPLMSGVNFQLYGFEKIYYDPSNPGLLSRVENFQYDQTNGAIINDSLEFKTFDFSHANPLNKTLKDLAYVADIFIIPSIPVNSNLSVITESYNCLNPYVVASANVPWWGWYPHFDLFNFTNAFSEHGITRSSTNALQTAGDIVYSYKQIFY